MNILFDQTEAQTSYINGAAEYAQTVFLKLVSLLDAYPDVTIYSLYQSNRPFLYNSLSEDSLLHYKRVIPVDFNGKTIKDVIVDNKIDIFFITCAQHFCELPIGDIKNLPCKLFIVIHDLYTEEMQRSKVLFFENLLHPSSFVHYSLSKIKGMLLLNRNERQKARMYSLLQDNDTEIITVSEYTKHCIIYDFPFLESHIHVFAAPEKTVNNKQKAITNEALSQVIGEKYFLLLSADRLLKNADRMLCAFEKFTNYTKSSYRIVTVGYPTKKFPNHISLPFLSSSDLDIAYQHCYALLYPSLFEGFGYPPVEAMKYSKPVLSSNVCSIPEVLGDAPIYFSPIYETDMFKALLTFTNKDYEDCCKLSLKRYKEISVKQKEDLDLLANALLRGTF